MNENDELTRKGEPLTKGKYLTFDEILSTDNLAELDIPLDSIAERVIERYEADDKSREKWMEGRKKALELAMMYKTAKNTPWPNASNMKFPLLTTAAMQFAARATDALLPSGNIVSCIVTGRDEDGMKADRAERISKHMTWQLREQMTTWLAGQDRLFHILPVVDCCHKKTYFDPMKGHNVSNLRLPNQLVINYRSEPDENPEYATDIIELTGNEIMERMTAGIFVEHQSIMDSIKGIEDDPGSRNDDDSDMTSEYITNGEANPDVFLEQHGWLDLDGDGYKEPYITTVHLNTRKVVRISKRFEPDMVTWTDSVQTGSDENGQPIMEGAGNIIRIEPEHYFTKYEVLPSMDGGYYGIGYGSLLSPINEGVNTGYNQLYDAGSLKNRQSGFVGKNVKLQAGSMKFKLGEWKQIDSTGADLRANIVPLPVGEPSAVTLELTSALLQYGEKMASVTDVMLGESPGANVPATTIVNLIEQGTKVFGSIIKRQHRSMKEEFKKLYRLNNIFLTPTEYFSVLDEPNEVLEVAIDDYAMGDSDVQPVADPTVSSRSQKLAVAQALMEIIGIDPQTPMQKAIVKYYIKAIAPDMVDTIMPDEEPNPAAEQAQMEQMQMQMEAMRADLLKLQAEGEKLVAETEKIQAETDLIDDKNDREDEQMTNEAVRMDTESAEREAKSKPVTLGEQSFK